MDYFPFLHITTLLPIVTIGVWPQQKVHNILVQDAISSPIDGIHGKHIFGIVVRNAIRSGIKIKFRYIESCFGYRI